MIFDKIDNIILENADNQIKRAFNDLGNLDDGVAHFTILNAVDYIAKSGNNFIKLLCEFSQEGEKSGKWERYMQVPNEGNIWRWSYFLKSIGYAGAGDFLKKYNGNIPPSIFKDKTGLCEIVIVSDSLSKKINIVRDIPADKVIHTIDHNSDDFDDIDF